jgi:transaldolase
MKFFIDTADVREIEDLAASGLVDGVTTNPSLIAKSGRNFVEVVREICAIVPGPVSAEVAAIDVDGMLAEGRHLARIAGNVCVKLPLTWEGLHACKALSRDGIATNVTLCFTAGQALLAAKAGATFVSPFIGRLDDIGHDGMGLIADIVEMYRQYPATIAPRSWWPPSAAPATSPTRPARRPRRDPAAQDPARPRQAPADRQGARRAS